jgi:hypothetical protein
VKWDIGFPAELQKNICLFFIQTIFFIFTLFQTSQHVRSKQCPGHCVAQAKADAELCCPSLPLN